MIYLDWPSLEFKGCGHKTRIDVPDLLHNRHSPGYLELLQPMLILKESNSE